MQFQRFKVRLLTLGIEYQSYNFYLFFLISNFGYQVKKTSNYKNLSLMKVPDLKYQFDIIIDPRLA